MLHILATSVRLDRPWVIGMFSGVIAFVAYLLVFQIWVHNRFEGRFEGPFLLTEKFGVSSRLTELGYRPCCFGQQAGWDGMYYFTQANDPFLCGNDLPRGFDNPSYRYQRNGIPLLAWSLAQLRGFEHTPAWWYHLVQMSITSLGVGVLAGWLTARHQSPLYALTWSCSGGLLLALFHGLGDAPADALFALSLLATFTGRLWIYTPTMTLLLLCREGYAAFAAPVFVLSSIGVIRWGGAPWVSRWLWTGFPGAILLAWTGYVAHALDTPLLAGARACEPRALLDWPFAAFARCLEARWEASQGDEVVYLLISVLTLVLIGVKTLWVGRRHPVFACAVPLLVLTSMTGTVMWEHHTGYLKNNGLVLILGVFLLPFARCWWLRVLLLANLSVGLHVAYQWGVVSPSRYSPDLVHYHIRSREPMGEPMHRIKEDFRSSVELIGNPAPTSKPTGSVFTRWYRSLWHYRVRVTNRSQLTWRPDPQLGMNSVNLVYFLVDDTGQKIDEGRIPLPRPVEPGESIELGFAVWQPAKPGPYALAAAMWQEGNCFFPAKDRGYGLSHLFSVP